MTTLFINTYYEACGVYQYGIRLYDCIKDLAIYCEANNYTDYTNVLAKYNPTQVIFNYHFLPMHWLTPENIVRGSLIKNIGILHESPTTMFDAVLDIDPSKPNGVPRPLCYNIPTTITTPELELFINYNKGPDVPIFGSFGFGSLNKGFDKLIRLVNEQYDNAIIKLVIPLGKYCGEDPLIKTIEACYQVARKPGIELLISNEFFENDDVLYFLSSNTMNLFLYDKQYGRGNSSAVDHALSVNVPFGITNSYMFRHIYNDCICVDKHSLAYIQKQTKYLDKIRARYSKENMHKFFARELCSRSVEPSVIPSVSEGNYASKSKDKTVSAIIPLGGTASRIMGIPKFLLPCGPQTTLLDRTLQHLPNTRIIAGTSLTNTPLILGYPFNKFVTVHTNTMTQTICQCLQSECDSKSECDSDSKSECEQEHFDATIMLMPDTYMELTNEIELLKESLYTCDVAAIVFKVNDYQKGKVGQCALKKDTESLRIIDVKDKCPDCDYEHFWGILAWNNYMNDAIDPEWPTIGNLIEFCIKHNLRVAAIESPGKYYDCGTYDEYISFVKTIL